MAVEPDSAGVRFPPPFVYLGALLLGLAAERFVTLRSFGIDWRLLVATGALLFVAGAAMMLAAAGLFRRLGTNVPPSQPTTLIATTGPYRWTRNPMYLGMALIYAGLAIGFEAASWVTAWSCLTEHVYTCRVPPTMELQALPCYCATLRQAARAATALYEAVLGDSGVPLTQLTALQVMSRSSNLTTTELAEMIGIDQTTATRTLAHIKKAGLARTTSGDDRRERRWVLSAEGERTVRKLMTKWEKAQAAFEARLGSADAAALKESAYIAARKLASR